MCKTMCVDVYRDGGLATASGGGRLWSFFRAVFTVDFDVISATISGPKMGAILDRFWVDFLGDSRSILWAILWAILLGYPDKVRPVWPTKNRPSRDRFRTSGSSSNLNRLRVRICSVRCPERRQNAVTGLHYPNRPLTHPYPISTPTLHPRCIVAES